MSNKIKKMIAHIGLLSCLTASSLSFCEDKKSEDTTAYANEKKLESFLLFPFTGALASIWASSHCTCSPFLRKSFYALGVSLLGVASIAASYIAYQDFNKERI